MIDPKELRIGNIIKDDRKSKEWRFVTHRVISDLASNPGVDLYHPVDLTEEWLIKFGFQQGVLGSWTKSITIFGNLRELSFSGDYLYLREGKEVFGSGEDDLCVLWNKDVMKQFYVHSLQNLFFALKNEELTIKE